MCLGIVLCKPINTYLLNSYFVNSKSYSVCKTEFITNKDFDSCLKLFFF